MVFIEAMKCLINGEKVRCVTWNEYEYIYLNKDNVILDEKGSRYAIGYIDNEFEWEIYNDYIELIEKNIYMYSDGMGGFIYVNKSIDMDDSVDILMELENEDDYDKLSVTLHKEDIKTLIKNLKQIIEEM